MKTSWYTLITILLISCSSASTNFAELSYQLQDLGSSEFDLRCRLRVLEDSTRRAWDQFNAELSSQFPETTSEYIRGKMLEMRNAELVRMFQTFDSLPDLVKTKLKETERKDALIVSEVESIQRKLDSIEMNAIQIFMKIEELFPDSLDISRNRYNQLSSIENCN